MQNHFSLFKSDAIVGAWCIFVETRPFLSLQRGAHVTKKRAPRESESAIFTFQNAKLVF